MLHWLQSLVADYGSWIVFTVLFLNNTGFPVPGDTILLAAGFFVEKGHLSLWAVFFSGIAGCFMGANCGYWIGLRFGHPLMEKMKWLKSNPEKIKRIEDFFKKHGPKAVFFARFVALLHPVIGLLAGTGRTPLKPFLVYNLAGSAAYVFIYVFAGYFFGSKWGLVKLWIGDGALYALLIAAILIAAYVGLWIWRFTRDFYAGKTPKP